MWPTRSAPSSPRGAGGPSRSVVIFRTARSVPGSRPTRVAGWLRPSGVSTVRPSSARTVCSAVTTMPGRQWMPVDGSRRRAWTATIDGAMRSTAPASSFESESNASMSRPPRDSGCRPQHAGGATEGKSADWPGARPPALPLSRDGGGRGLAGGQRGPGAGAHPIEALEEALDVVDVAVHVRGDADAPLPAPDQHALLGEAPGEPGRIVGQEAHVAGALGGRLGRQNR